MCTAAASLLVLSTSVVALGQPLLPAAPPGVETSSSYGIEFSTVRAGNNLPFHAESSYFPVDNRGVVAGDFRMSRTEITTSQWLTFVNTFSTTSNDLYYFAEPTRWAARPDPTYSGPGARWQLDPSVTSAADRPIAGIPWRTAAMYCNWLTNGCVSDPASLTYGAYDTSTFGMGGPTFGSGFTDQQVHSPGALYWIPTLDEWIRAAFTSPSSDRWWLSHYGSDTDPVSGPPGTPGAQTDAGAQFNPFNPVNSYGAQSPWGLLGTSGGVDEWLEDAVGISSSTGLPVYRRFVSDHYGTEFGGGLLTTGLSVDYPYFQAYTGLRLASVVPGGGFALFPVSLALLVLRRKR